MTNDERKLDASKLIRPRELAHVVLRCSDVNASARWYATFVGMEAVFENDFVAFMTFDAEHHRIALIQTKVAGAAPPGAPGLDHFAYSYRSMGELLASYLRLKAEGILPVWCVNHGPTTSLYYEDPDGNRAELQFDNFATEQELKDFLKRDSFAANPIGVSFDPDRLVARYEAGDPIAELVEQGAA